MEQWFAVSVHICGELRNVLQIAFGGYRLLQVIGGAALHSVLVGGISDDPFFLGGGHGARVNSQGNAVFFAEVTQYSLFACRGRIFAQRPYTAESISANKIVREKFYHGRSDHVKEILLRLGRKFFINGTYFLLQDNPPLSDL